jgi:DNA invertase Pin-like site-specific DNA recombinase
MTAPLVPTRAAGEPKIQPRHRDRLAIVYVRQSTAHQVQRHRESTELQYSLTGVAQQRHGWPADRVVVIDDDLGLSGTSADTRPGFQRLLAEVALGHVGLILGVDMSRLARSCKDWYHLLEVCGLFGTLIGDLDGVYDPASYNDRLLLGLKGTMSEAELHVLRQRMRQGVLQKARRGELVTRVPVGYVRAAGGGVELDADEQVRSVVGLVFDLFDRLGSAAAVLRHLADQKILLPIRPSVGPTRGHLEWRPANNTTIRNILRHPMYAGAYVYGRTRQRRRPDGRVGREHLPGEEWLVTIRDRHPAYITWDRYERNRERLAGNRRTPGRVRSGAALLAGRVVCGRCGATMTPQYAGPANQPRYLCVRERVARGGPSCQSLAARVVDAEVSRLALLALAPAAVDVSLRAAADLEQRHAQAIRLWDQRLERADYEADRARRQHAAVEPENRLVARTLEAAWEEKLRTAREVREEYDRFLRSRPRLLTADEQARIRGLALDLPSLWNADATTPADRKAILHLVVERVVVTVEGDTEWVAGLVTWVGGHQTQTRFRRPVARLEQLGGWAAIRARILELRAAGSRSPAIAAALNREGLCPPNGKAFTSASVLTWLSRYGGAAERSGVTTGEAEWFIPDLARALGVNGQTVYTWIRKGRVTARQVGGRQGRWVVRGTLEEFRRMMANRDRWEKRTGRRSDAPPRAGGTA